MPLMLAVILIVVGVFAVAGAVGCLIDRSAERFERQE